MKRRLPQLLACLLSAATASARDSAVIINEIHYHPADELTQTEWIELRCLHGVDVDLSGWQLEGGVNYTFPAGTVISGRSFLVVAQTPGLLAGVTALGPWTGKLDNGGEEIRLVNANDREMDRVTYSDSGDWPVGPDGSGVTLARRLQSEAQNGPAAWAPSNELGGTPGSTNFYDADTPAKATVPVPIDSAVWKYNDTNTAPSATWKDLTYTDTGWATGRALFYRGTARIADPVAAATVLTGPGDGLISYWPMNDSVGSTTAANSVAGGAVGTLNGTVGTNVAFTTDAPRGKVLRVNINASNANVTGSWVAAGSLPVMSLANNFTWAFWGKTNQGVSSNVILGNRYNGPGAADFSPREFIKFTNNAFEWHRQNVGENLDYVDIPSGSWIHHAVVKAGNVLTYYRNGAAAGTITITATPVNAQPFFMGGNGTSESWPGWLDDVALWNKAVPATSVAALAANTYTPATLPTNVTFVDNGPYPIPADIHFPVTSTAPLTDDFAPAAVDALKWDVIDQGLENTGVSGLTATQNGGLLTIAGTTTVNYWAGKSLRSVASFSSRARVTAEVDRVSLTGTGTAYRSSLWLWADANHYLHFSQNMNEGGWSWNANDVGGSGTSIATGSGNNLGTLDFADANGGLAHMKLVWIPGAYAGQGSIQIWRDTTLAGTATVTNWPATFKVLLTGQARQATAAPPADTVSAVFDNASVTVATPVPLQTAVNPATTHYFRNTFSFTGDPTRTTLILWPIHDDGAVYYLNGTQILRDNVAASPAHGTFATAAVVDASFPKNPISIPAGLLVNGTNVLSAEVHQDSAASPDMLFGAQLMASEVPGPPRDAPSLRLTEISGSVDAVFRVELANTSATSLNLAGFILADTSGHSYSLTGSLAGGQFLTLDETTLGFRPIDGARLSLRQGNQFYDARTVTGRLRGLNAAGDWAWPDSATFGSANVFTTNTDIVINEIMYNAPSPSPEQWVELYNRGTSPVDVSGWKFTDGITYEFPAATPPIPAGGYALVVWDVAAFNLLHPGLPRVFGPFTDKLTSSGERLRLRYANGNLANETSYVEGGAWPAFTSGTASSIELRSPKADNANGSAWAASNETLRGSWQNVSYTFPGTIYESDPSYYSELILGLLNDGEVLVDDISVKQDPAGTNLELIQNGNFSAGTTDKWRFPGCFRRSTVVDDPDSPGNKVLKLISGGSIDHMANHAETTLKSGTVLLGTGGLNAAVNYTISFRARWQKGNNALNSHLYFNRGPATTILARPTTGGTPGLVNSTFSATAGITLAGVSHSPAVPAAGTAATITARVDDPENTTSVSLIYSVNEGTEQTVAMSSASGVWTGTIPAQAASAKANFRLVATNLLGHTATWPAAGMSGRAIVPWDDSQAQLVRPNGCRPHNVRIVMTAADTTLLHLASNVMSNDWIPCTVIYDEREIYYGTSVHLKGSEHGRAKQSRAGFLIRFPADHLFLGVHNETAIDRSGAGDQFSQKEILVKRSLNRAGGIFSTEDDLIRVIAPQSQHTGPAIFIHNKMDSDEFLDGQLANGSKGTMFEYELLYPLYSGNIATSTDNTTLEGNKLTQDGPFPYGPTGVNVRALQTGTPRVNSLNEEDYRWYWLIKNNRTTDDYSGLMTALTAIGQSGAAFHTQTAPLLDTDGWLRSLTGPVAWAVGDNYAYGAQHNALYYVKPDGKTLYVPWDMDFTANTGSGATINPNAELGKMINTLAGTPADANRRAYYGYLLHMVDAAMNPRYLKAWMDHYTCFVDENLTGNFLQFVTDRETSIRSQISASLPVVPFQITTNGGNNYSEPLSTTTLAGDGWVNVATIRLAGGAPLAVTWTDQDSWSLQLPVVNGVNVFNLEARDLDGTLVATDSITVTGTGGVVPSTAANVLLTEINYHPAVLGEEFLELLNLSPFTVDLSGCIFTAGIVYTFPSGTLVASGARILVVENRTAFQARYPTVLGLAPGAYAPSNLSNGGETVTLRAADGLSDIFSVTYSDSIASTDGPGRTLVRVVGCAPNPADFTWRESTANGGNPGTTDALMFTGDPLADADSDGHSALIEYAFGTSDTVWNAATDFLQPSATLPTWAAPLPNADCAIITLETSDDLITWTTASNPSRRYWRLRATQR